MKYYSEEEYQQSLKPQPAPQAIEYGCGYCWDKKKQRNKELYFLDAANNMRTCKFCPYCGRKY